MRPARPRFLALLIVLAAFTFVDRAAAQIINGNFETGNFNGWGVVTLSNAVVTTAPGGTVASNGTNQAVLTLGIVADIFSISNELTAGNTLGYTFTPANWHALTAPQGCFEGSVAFQQFTSSAGTLSFNFAFENNEDPSDPYHDTLFFYLDGTFYDLRDANVDPTDTIYASFSTSISNGQHFAVFGVLNPVDNLWNSRGVFDNFFAPAASVPEPTTWALLGATVMAGLVALSRWRRRQQRVLDELLVA
jgi:hypothetical protein